MKSFPIFILSLAVVFSAVPGSVLAAKFQAGETVTIPKEETISDNTYLAGGEVTVSSAPLKDLVAAGGQLTINAQVWGDALLAGGNVNILEPVQGDLRVAGGQIKVAHAVKGDAIIAGGQVSILPGASIAGDTVLAGGDIVFDGIANGVVRIYGGTVRINGTVSGPLYIRAGESVSFGDKAVIKSQIIYTAPEEAAVAEGAKLPTDVQFTEAPLPKKSVKENVMKGVLAALGIFFFLKFLALLLVVVLATSVFKTLSMKLAMDALSRFWFMLLIGFVTLIAVPVAFVVLMVTVIGMYVGFILVTLYGLALLAACVYSNVTAGALLAKLIKKEVRVNWKWGVLGLVVLSLVSLIPVIGWVAVSLLFLSSLGAVVMSLFRDAKAKV